MGDNWDDDGGSGSTAVISTTIQSNSSFGRGVSVGRGRGFGNLSALSNALPNPGQANGISNDCAWDENGDNSWPNKNSGGGGGGSSWPSNNNNSSDGWGSKFNNSDDTPRGGGSRGGGGGGGSKICFRCNEEGHMSRECPNPPSNNRGGGGKACFKCNEEGHMSRECPNPPSNNRGGGGKACFKCNEEGHMSRDCPNPPSNNRGGGGKACFKCNEEGHMSRDCPNPSSNNRSGGGKVSCYNCGQEGHMSRECTNESTSNKRGTECRKCGEEGHMARDCPDAEKRPSSCFNCGEEGHMSRECPNPPKDVGPDGKPRSTYVPPEPTDDESTLFESVPTGINFDRYDSIQVNVSGSNPPKPIRTFSDANFRELLNKNIKKSKYAKPTPVQRNAIPMIMAKRDLMACAQTGSGKTAAFLLPMLQAMFESPDLPNNKNSSCQEPWAVIMSPTRELAIQIYNEARKFSHDSIVQCSLIYGGTSVQAQSSRLQRGCHILVATPGRLLDFVDKGKVSFSQLHYLVLDEADRMLDMGFMPEVKRMVNNPSMPEKGQRQTLMFSATFPKEIQELASEFLHDYLFLVVGMVGAANQDVRQNFFPVSQFDKKDKLVEILRESGTDRTLVFVEKKRTADFLASFLCQSNFMSTSIHGDRMQKEREEALNDFRTGRMPILVATAVAARGLDIKDVRHVVNYDLPEKIDEYVHRIGRTGRVGNLGTATSFFDSGNDAPLASDLIKILSDAQQEVPDWLLESSGGGGGGGGGYRGRFTTRDIRKDAKTHSDWDSNQPSGGGFSSQPDNDESWD